MVKNKIKNISQPYLLFNLKPGWQSGASGQPGKKYLPSVLSGQADPAVRAAGSRIANGQMKPGPGRESGILIFGL